MENKGIYRIATIISIIFMAIAAIFVILIWIKGDDSIETNTTLQGSILDPFFIISYIALILGIIVALAFPVAYVVMNPRKALKGLMVVGGVVIVLLVSYALSPNTYSDAELDVRNISALTARWVGTGLVFTYIVCILAIISAIFSGISKIFK